MAAGDRIAWPAGGAPRTVALSEAARLAWLQHQRLQCSEAHTMTERPLSIRLGLTAAAALAAVSTLLVAGACASLDVGRRGGVVAASPRAQKALLSGYENSLGGRDTVQLPVADATENAV